LLCHRCIHHAQVQVEPAENSGIQLKNALTPSHC